jgi:mono/diheme cytochrome c family protein
MLALLLMMPLAPAQAADTTAAQQLERFAAQAGAPGQAERGRSFFTSRHGGEWSCASCHGQTPTAGGKHASTGKAIDPLAPAFNPRAFTDGAKVDKWFRRNCKDVLQRECSAGEKAEVLAFLLSLRP